MSSAPISGATASRTSAENALPCLTLLFLITAAYGLVTPLGIAIGVGVRNTFQPNDPNTILVIGILDSLSAGVLLYGALVNLLAKDFLTGEMLDASNLRLGGALLSMFVGAALMSLCEFVFFQTWFSATSQVALELDTESRD